MFTDLRFKDYSLQSYVGPNSVFETKFIAQKSPGAFTKAFSTLNIYMNNFNPRKMTRGKT